MGTDAESGGTNRKGDDLMTVKLKRSPINYMGGKFNSLKYMREHFPTNINTFYDIFTGSGTVPLNIKAEKYVINDRMPHLTELHKYLIETKYEVIYDNILHDIDEYDLNDLSGDGYYRLREIFNERNNPRLLFALITHSFNYIMRFNMSGEFNASFGRGKCKLGDNMLDKLRGYTEVFNKGNTKVTTKDFREYFDADMYKEGDFVYLDPPYELTVAVYNENGGWGEKDAEDVLSFIADLDSKGINFGYSNTLESKGVHNKLLQSFINDNPHLKIISNKGYLNGVPSTRKHRGKDVEVFITNGKETI